MTPTKIKALLDEFSLPNTSLARSTEIHLELIKAMERFSAYTDADLLELILGTILIRSGSKRPRKQIMAQLPTIVMICGDRDNTSRLADFPEI